jgi:hypothetical protein
MERLNFSINIAAPREKVWNVLLGEKTYPEWTSAFAPGSAAETDWQEGGKALFHDGKGNGMVSKIERNIPNEYISIRHLGICRNGVEDYASEEVKNWADMMENYTLEKSGNGTLLKIEMDSNREYKDFFLKSWPLALDKVKVLSEE